MTERNAGLRADVVILTAIRLELDAVLAVDAGAVPGSAWETAVGPSGLPVVFRSFALENGQPLRVAVAVSPDMGPTAAVNTLLPLVEALEPRCVAMCGVCAGRSGKTNLGDVVAADRLYYHDTGKQLPGQVQQDLTVYKLRDDWKLMLEGMDATAHFRDQTWLKARPLTTEWREHRALVAMHRGQARPWEAVDPTLEGGEWPAIVETLRKRGLLAGRELTDQGRTLADDLLFQHGDDVPDLSPTGTLLPFKLHVAPIGSGSKVIEDKEIWTFVSQAMRKTLGIEMEAAAVAELVHRQRHRHLDAVVMKGVMDFADHGRDDHFKRFAARASAECLLWFLRKALVSSVTDAGDHGARRAPSSSPSSSSGASSSSSSSSSSSGPANKHTILFLAANPTDMPPAALDRQARAIQKELERSTARDDFAFETRFATSPLDLLRELTRLKPSVVHFCGHGSQAGLYFQAETGNAQLVPAAALAEAFGAAGDSVKLVVLAACYSGPQAEALLAHVDCVVGVSDTIGDDSARTFAIGFYGGLGERASIAAAYKHGRAAIGLDGFTGGDRLQLKVRPGVDASRLVLASSPR